MNRRPKKQEEVQEDEPTLIVVEGEAHQQEPMLEELDSLWDDSGEHLQKPSVLLLLHAGAVFAVLSDQFTVYTVMDSTQKKYMTAKSNCELDEAGEAYLASKIQRISCHFPNNKDPLETFGRKYLAPVLSKNYNSE